MSLGNILLSSLKKQSTYVFGSSHLRCCSTGSLVKKEKTKWAFFQPIDDTFRKHFPKLHKSVHFMSNGTSALMKDVFKYATFISRKNVDFNPQNLTLENLELYYELGHQLKRLLPVLCIIALPFGNLIAAPLAYKYPKELLSSHFWTENQKKTFAVLDHEQRVQLYKPLISKLYHPFALDLRPEWGKLLDDLQNGKTPSFNALWSCRRLFDAHNPPLYLDNLSSEIMDMLIKMHGLNHRIPINKRSKLNRYFTYLKCVDNRITSSLSNNSISDERLTKFCFQRGVNANEMTQEEMQSYLRQWLKFSNRMPLENCTFLLVLPALLTLNHPSNRSILDKSRSI